MEDPYFYLEGVVREKDELKDFEGPLSLILMLLQKNKIEIRDIRISEILDQYLDYIGKMQELDLEGSSEFVRMASYLLYIKTKTLLSGEEEVSELEALMESLEALKCKDSLAAVREIAPLLGDAYSEGALLYSRAPEPAPSSAAEYPYSHKPVELLKALLQLFTSTEARPPELSQIARALPQRIVYSIRAKSRQILDRLRIRNISLNELYAECRSRSELVATFISVLELCSMGSLVVSVSRHGDGYDLSFAGGDIDEILEQIEES